MGRRTHLFAGIVELAPHDAHALGDLTHGGLLGALAQQELLGGVPLLVGEDEVGRQLLRSPHGARAVCL